MARKLVKRRKRGLGQDGGSAVQEGQNSAKDNSNDASQQPLQEESEVECTPGSADKEALLAWLKAGGATLEGAELRAAEGMGMGLFATRPLSVGAAVFSLPAELMLTAERAAASSVGAAAKKLCGEWREACSPEFLICLSLVAARACPEDPFHAYARSLPRSPPGLEAWPPQHCEAVEGTDLGAALGRAREEMRAWKALLERLVQADPSTFRPDVFQGESLKWARGMWRSRHFPGAFAGRTETGGTGCLVPLLDLLNHSPVADVTVRVRGSRLEFSVDSEVDSGGQVWNNYGAKSNEETLLCYGFAIDDNPEDCVRLAWCPSVGETASELCLTREGLSEELLKGLELEGDEGLPRFVGLLRALGSRHKAVRGCLERLPSASAVDTDGRWRHLRRYLDGQLAVLEACLEGLQQARAAAAKAPPRKRRRGAPPRS